jgi:2',3'-cyclic-nucleotide 2'-phosphodiesterase (5'-nucleotidase family)
VKTKALLEGMRRLGYDAVNVGERDVRSGWAEFVERTGPSKLRFTSANLVRQDDMRPVLPPHLVLDVADGKGGKRRVGVIGVVRYNPLFLKTGPDETNMVIDHPKERVEKEVRALREKGVDLIVLLAAMHQPDAQRLATEIDGIDYILGSYGGVFHNTPLVNDETTLFYCGNKGQRVGEMRLFFEAGKARPSHEAHMHFLTATYPTDATMLEFVNSVPAKPETEQSELGERILAPLRPGGSRARMTNASLPPLSGGPVTETRAVVPARR